MEDLSIGERLALKGQLFELQKKLNIIDQENRSKEQHTFQPESFTEDYKPVTDRESNYVKNVERAEIIRQQRLEMLKATRDMEASMTNTFSPEISARSKKLQHAKKSTAFERLYESASIIRENKRELSNKVTSYDSQTGQKLYHPKITVQSKKIVSTADTDTNAHEFMYRDAMDREERLRQLSRKNKADLEKQASSSKVNLKSKQLLNQRAERETRALFDALDIDTVGELSYDNVLRGSEIIASKGRQHKEDVYKTAQRVWDYCGGERDGYVTFEVFSKKAHPFVTRTAQSATLPSFHLDLAKDTSSARASTERTGKNQSKREKGKDNDHFEGGKSTYEEAASQDSRDDGEVSLGNDTHSDGGNVETSAYIETDLDVFKRYVYNLLQILQASKEYAKSIDISRIKTKKYVDMLKNANHKGEGTFAPTIGATSRRLALSKEERDINALMHLVDESGAEEIKEGDDSGGNGKESGRTKKQGQGKLSPPKGLKLLWARTEALKKRKEEKVKEFLDKEMNECTFQPRINKGGTTPTKSRPQDSHYPYLTVSTPIVTGSSSTGSTEQAIGEGTEMDTSSANVDPSLPDNNNRQGENIPMPPRVDAEDEDKASLTLPPAPTSSSEELEPADNAVKREEGEDEYEYFDEHGNRIDPADLHEGHIIVDGGSDLDAKDYTEAELAAMKQQREFIRELNELPVAERLYAQRNIHRPLRVKYKGRRDSDELEKCTFKPKTKPYVPPAHASKPRETLINPTGWDQSISRMRAAAEKKRLALLKKAEEHLEADKAYQESLKRSAEGFKEFNFRSEERIRAKKENDSAGKPQPRLYIDVKLAKNHVVNLALHDGDDPHIMAERFCAIYGFAKNKQSKTVLEEVIRQSMELNGIEIARGEISTVPGLSRPSDSSGATEEEAEDKLRESEDVLIIISIQKMRIQNPTTTIIATTTPVVPILSTQAK